ncbi:hypothetical protein HOLleu_29132 [Holothuria leucospilota]|uniref:Uncharacterized protein n=1 Tax=Holothuria leucospilota TaxID=206669 RepID=A0A9Q1BN43_HOLLE|nr:hypothetical protein HOLleu_29132 [Holothuria leucospilota]
MERYKPPPPLSLQGNLAENFKRWKQRFQLYLEASELSTKPEKHQCAVLLHVAGDEALELYNTFTFADEESKEKVNDVLKKFEEFCNPRKNLTYERHLFFTRNQGTSESFDHYVTDLKRLAQSCEFNTLQDGLIWDRIVCGLVDNKLRERLLRDADLTLEKTITTCRASETSKNQLKTLTGTSDYSVHNVQSKNKAKHSGHPNRGKPKKKSEKSNSDTGAGKPFITNCGRCGRDHFVGECPAYGQTCKKCGRKNHFAKCCRTKPDKKVNTISGNTPEIQSASAAASYNEDSDFYIGALGDDADPVDPQPDKSSTEWKESGVSTEGAAETIGLEAYYIQ